MNHIPTIKRLQSSKEAEKKYQMIVYFALFTMVAAPIGSVILYPSTDGVLTIKVASYVIGFWVFVLGAKFISILNFNARYKYQRLAEAEQTPKKELLGTEESIDPLDQNEILNRLVVYGNGNRDILKKLYRSTNRGMTIFILCIYSFVMVTPFMLLGYLSPFTPAYLIGGILLYWVLVAFIDLIRGDQNPQAQALGLMWNKEIKEAVGSWASHETNLVFSVDGVTTKVKKQSPTFKATFQNGCFNFQGATDSQVDEFLSTLHNKDLWKGVKINATGSTITITREYRLTADGVPINDYWLCDLWLTEKI
jgi:hypothetical protein